MECGCRSIRLPSGGAGGGDAAATVATQRSWGKNTSWRARLKQIASLVAQCCQLLCLGAPWLLSVALRTHTRQ